LSSLETQIEKLTRENEELRAQTRSSSINIETDTASETRPTATSSFSEDPGTSNENSNNLEDRLVKSVRHVVTEPSRQPQFLGQSSGITLAKLVMTAIKLDKLPAPAYSESHPYGHASIISAPEASLPPRQAADHLVEVYFQYRTPHLALIERSQVEESLKSAYLAMDGHPPSGRFIERDIFYTYMVFAIALCDVTNPAG
jgi:hypothetical protein